MGDKTPCPILDISGRVEPCPILDTSGGAKGPPLKPSTRRAEGRANLDITDLPDTFESVEERYLESVIMPEPAMMTNPQIDNLLLALDNGGGRHYDRSPHFRGWGSPPEEDLPGDAASLQETLESLETMVSTATADTAASIDDMTESVLDLSQEVRDLTDLVATQQETLKMVVKILLTIAATSK